MGIKEIKEKLSNYILKFLSVSMGVLLGIIAYNMLFTNSKYLAHKKQIFKHFKIEKTYGLFFNTTKLIQMDKPLTNEEMEIMYDSNINFDA